MTGEHCDLCGEAIGDEHPHVVDVSSRMLLCACHACHLVLAPDGAGGARYRAVPDRYLVLDDVELSTTAWEALQIPVSVAFFFVNSTLDRVAAFYPGPAGATESLLSLERWQDVVATNPSLGSLAPDVEAVLVRADPRGERSPECYVVPIDACYELVGRLRMQWRGFDGGAPATTALDEFFDRIRSRAVPV